MNTPTPAVVTQRAAEPMPRWALLLLCAAYVLPGVFGRDPWKNADIAAFGAMREMVMGGSWFNPSVAGLPMDGGVLPYWLGAAAIMGLGDLLGAPLAARLAFATVLAGTLMLLWYATYHLARSDAAQPLAFAFGGQASPVNYARAIADAAVLALIASLGLLQLGHETTPELVQLLAVCLYMYGLAAHSNHPVKSASATVFALPVLAASGAPLVALVFGVAGMVVSLASRLPAARTLLIWVVLSTVLAVVVTWLQPQWPWHLGTPRDLPGMARLLVWFTWPVWPLALWTLWRWRGHLTRRHVAVPLSLGLIGLAASYLMTGNQRALMLALPPMAVLAAFALPTLKRSLSAAIDWFTLFFFSIIAIALWVIYVSMHIGIPAKPAANVVKLAPGFEPVFSAPALIFAVVATAAWIWLVNWRVGRHRPALWKSLVLPAGGVALSWLLLLTLTLPVLDYARSYRPGSALIAQIVPRGACVHVRHANAAQLAAWSFYNAYQFAQPGEHCDWLIVADERGGNGRDRVSAADWRHMASVRRPADKREVNHLFRRAQPDADTPSS